MNTDESIGLGMRSRQTRGPVGEKNMATRSFIEPELVYLNDVYLTKSESFTIHYKNNFQNPVEKNFFDEMKRIFWEKEEKIELDKSFSQNPHPDMATKELLAEKFRVNVEKITNFFKNKRQKLRKNGQSIKQVFRDEKSKKVLKESAKVMTTLQKPENILTPLVKSDDKNAIFKIESESEYQGAPAPNPIGMSTASSTLGRFSEALLEGPKINTGKLIRKIPKMGLSAKTSSDSIRRRFKTNQHVPIQSFFPLFTSDKLPQMPIDSTYLPIQTLFIPSCLDSTARQYFPINPSVAVPMGNDENNLQELNESDDTGNETDSFERVSEEGKEVEIKPHPRWFPFSALYPNQPIYPKTNPFLSC